MERMGNDTAFCAKSMQGNRERQEDYWICRQTDQTTVAIVCDGMGGMAGGNIASRMAAELLLEDLKKPIPTENMRAFFKSELERLDDAVYRLKYVDGTRIGAGTTLVAAIIQDSGLYWFSVGDSKLFYIRGRELYCVTRAHNYASFMQGKHPPERKQNAEGEQLISYLGMGMAELFDGNNVPFPVKQGDRLLLCTDGLYRTVTEKEIAGILEETDDPADGSRRLEQAVLQKKNAKQDNATWILLRV